MPKNAALLEYEGPHLAFRSCHLTAVRIHLVLLRSNSALLGAEKCRKRTPYWVSGLTDVELLSAPSSTFLPLTRTRCWKDTWAVFQCTLEATSRDVSYNLPGTLLMIIDKYLYIPPSTADPLRSPDSEISEIFSQLTSREFIGSFHTLFEGLNNLRVIGECQVMKRHSLYSSDRFLWKLVYRVRLHPRN